MSLSTMSQQIQACLLDLFINAMMCFWSNLLVGSLSQRLGMDNTLELA